MGEEVPMLHATIWLLSAGVNEGKKAEAQLMPDQTVGGGFWMSRLRLRQGRPLDRIRPSLIIGLTDWFLVNRWGRASLFFSPTLWCWQRLSSCWCVQDLFM